MKTKKWQLSVLLSLICLMIMSFFLAVPVKTKKASAAEIGGGAVSTYDAVETTNVQAPYLDISNMGRSKDSRGSYWLIKIHNLNNFSVQVYYNDKMCGANDAKNWEDLYDIRSITLNGNDDEDVKIYTNGLATHVTVSWVDFNSYSRYITCGNKLNTNTYMKKYVNVVRQQS